MALVSLRDWLVVTAGVISRAQGVLTIGLAVHPRERDGWRLHWAKLTASIPNCDVV